MAGQGFGIGFQGVLSPSQCRWVAVGSAIGRTNSGPRHQRDGWFAGESSQAVCVREIFRGLFRTLVFGFWQQQSRTVVTVVLVSRPEFAPWSSVKTLDVGDNRCFDTGCLSAASRDVLSVHCGRSLHGLGSIAIGIFVFPASPCSGNGQG